MKQNLGELKPVSFTTYQDSHGRTIVPDRKRHIAYILEDRKQQGAYNLYANRYVLAAVVAILAGYYWSWIWGPILGVAVAAALEYMYRQRFLPSLQSVSGVDFPARMTFYSVAQSNETSRNVIIIVLGFSLAVLLMVNLFMTVDDWDAVFAFQDVNNLLMLVFSVAMALGACYLSVQTLRAQLARPKQSDAKAPAAGKGKNDGGKQ